MWLGELPGFGAQRSLDEVSHREEKQHNEHPGKFPGDHGDVVVSLVHELLATGDGGAVVSLRAADLVIPTDVLSTSPDGINCRVNKKRSSERRQRSALVEKHRSCVQRGEVVQ